MRRSQNSSFQIPAYQLFLYIDLPTLSLSLAVLDHHRGLWNSNYRQTVRQHDICEEQWGSVL